MAWHLWSWWMASASKSRERRVRLPGIQKYAWQWSHIHIQICWKAETKSYKTLNLCYTGQLATRRQLFVVCSKRVNFTRNILQNVLGNMHVTRDDLQRHVDSQHFARASRPRWTEFWEAVAQKIDGDPFIRANFQIIIILSCEVLTWVQKLARRCQEKSCAKNRPWYHVTRCSIFRATLLRKKSLLQVVPCNTAFYSSLVMVSSYIYYVWHDEIKTGSSPGRCSSSGTIYTEATRIREIFNGYCNPKLFEFSFTTLCDLFRGKLAPPTQPITCKKNNHALDTCVSRAKLSVPRVFASCSHAHWCIVFVFVVIDQLTSVVDLVFFFGT